MDINTFSTCSSRQAFIYIFTIVGLYFLYGFIIIFGADLFLNRYGSLLESKQLLIAQLILGILLLIISQLMDSKKARLRASERAAQGGGGILNWRKRIMRDRDTNKNALITLIGLALTAVMLAQRTLEPLFVRLDNWLTKNVQSTTAWVIGIVGFLLSVNAVYALEWF